ncbi:uncharacterized protein [Anas platyrhynchos]|uniref:uncharacterized protein isoform X2 n=1 Tax=Anas platyrhynchos TaxID=8839 RepID=UPI003AF268D2
MAGERGSSSWGCSTSPLLLHIHRVPMGKRRSPPVLWWRQLLGTGCWWLLSLSRTALEGLRWLWRLAWYLLICYKSCWDFAFQFTEELGSVLLLRVQNSSERSEEDDEEEDRASTAALEPEGTVVELQRLREASEAALGRLEALEADVRFLCTELGAEKLLWSSRFLELLREQQGLRQRLQELPWDRGDSPEVPGDVEEPNASGSEGEGPAAFRNKEPDLQKPPLAPFTR